jgi:hypothetical protein
MFCAPHLAEVISHTLKTGKFSEAEKKALEAAIDEQFELHDD